MNTGHTQPLAAIPRPTGPAQGAAGQRWKAAAAKGCRSMWDLSSESEGQPATVGRSRSRTPPKTVAAEPTATSSVERCVWGMEEEDDSSSESAGGSGGQKTRFQQLEESEPAGATLPPHAPLPGTGWWSQFVWDALAPFRAKLPSQPTQAFTHEGFCAGAASELFACKAPQ